MHSWQPTIKNNKGEQLYKCKVCGIIKIQYRTFKQINDKQVFCEYWMNGNLYYQAPPCKKDLSQFKIMFNEK